MDRGVRTFFYDPVMYRKRPRTRPNLHKHTPDREEVCGCLDLHHVGLSQPRLIQNSTRARTFGPFHIVSPTKPVLSHPIRSDRRRPPPHFPLFSPSTSTWIRSRSPKCRRSGRRRIQRSWPLARSTRQHTTCAAANRGVGRWRLVRRHLLSKQGRRTGTGRGRGRCRQCTRWAARSSCNHRTTTPPSSSVITISSRPPPPHTCHGTSSYYYAATQLVDLNAPINFIDSPSAQLVWSRTSGVDQLGASSLFDGLSQPGRDAA